MPRRVRAIVLVVCLLGMPLLLAACTAKEIPYEEEIATRRAEIDRFMREASESPIPQADRATFPPLPYYPVNQEYRVPASLVVAAPVAEWPGGALFAAGDAKILVHERAASAEGGPPNEDHFALSSTTSIRCVTRFGRRAATSAWSRVTTRGDDRPISATPMAVS